MTIEEFFNTGFSRPVPPKLCLSNTSTYVPWSWGELFECTGCHARARQHHNTQPIDRGEATYESIYPMPPHEVKS